MAYRRRRPGSPRWPRPPRPPSRPRPPPSRVSPSRPRPRLASPSRTSWTRTPDAWVALQEALGASVKKPEAHVTPPRRPCSSCSRSSSSSEDGDQHHRGAAVAAVGGSFQHLGAPHSTVDGGTLCRRLVCPGGRIPPGHRVLC
ncbi:apoptosis associated tyrosine kinase [Phyllostomus discolor]|uniref:Apoptosis associated tyrosine kinase n=1 Tax=Phyllostomus discolor TaxID=89673 RepID=A0A833ZDI9_9CHIR|nr:apoptosis associated tyrosine kinase [Phyllostomus discolor]